MKAMNALRGMKLCYQDRDTTKAWTATIRVISLICRYIDEGVARSCMEIFLIWGH